ncbi:hypothetical protein IAQ61_003290, partial [Plenodomus lingam]|uniref:uncharacterized protein n=1 Tax=Leptosphaeria maculans TaxID=5022 RepID=UPI00331F0154
MSYNSVHVAYFATVPYLQKVTPSLDIRVNLSGLTATQYSGSPPCQLAVSLHSDSYYFRCKIHIERQILVSSVLVVDAIVIRAELYPIVSKGSSLYSLLTCLRLETQSSFSPSAIVWMRLVVTQFEATSYRTTGVVGLRLMLNDGVPWLLWATVQGLSSAYMRRLR